MPSPFAETLAERLLHRLPPDRAYDRAALEEAAEESALPRTVRHFLERMMTRRVEIERERLRVLRQPWLDHEHEEVQRAEENLLTAVRRHVQFPAAAWERVLRHASARVVAYLMRPVPALEDFLFGSGTLEMPAEDGGTDDAQNALPADVVQRRLSYFSAYPYLRKATSTYIEQRDVSAFERQRLVALLRRVDEKMCADHDAEGWLRLLQPLFALAEVAYPDHEGVPAEVLEAFFEEKKATLPLERLRMARRERDRAAFSPAALAEVITAEPAPSLAPPEEKVPPRSEPVPERDATAERSPDPNGQAPAAPDPPPAPDEDDAGEPATDDAPVPLWKQYQGPEPDDADEAPVSSSSDGGDEPRPRWQQFSVVSEGQAPPPEGAQGRSRLIPVAEASDAQSQDDAPSLRSLEEDVLGHAADNRALFVRELFGGSEAEYERVLRRLRGIEDWQTATQVIARDVFRAHKVNIYSDPARSFTNAVEARFR